MTFSLNIKDTGHCVVNPKQNDCIPNKFDGG